MTMNRAASRAFASVLARLVAARAGVCAARCAAAAFAALEATDTTWDGSEPPQGDLLPLVRAVLLHRLRARAPRIPRASHIELSRGNQVRVTVVLGDAELDAYLDDLALRRADLPGADRRAR